MLDELAGLVSAAGGQVVARTYQRRSAQRPSSAAARAGNPAEPTVRIASGPAIDPATYVGRGKAAHIAELTEAHEANVVVFDNELSPAQIRELETITGCRVLDRSELILDIFASRARTREAKLQVELAQLQYTAPRLRGMWTHLERQAGTGGANGMGLRGPGEKQIEIDRRIVRKRISRLQGELATLHGRKQREVAHRSDQHYCVGLVGYTNAGKSTLMNALTRAGTYSADQLFATLDTKTRMWKVERGVPVMLSDTVGFVRDLPHSLVASFRATLEEALNADLLLHVIDASHPQALRQIDTVESVLSELGAEPGKMLGVLNKVDAVSDPDDLAVLRRRLDDGVVVSAATGEGLEQLAATVAERRRQGFQRLLIRAPLGSGKLQAFARARGYIAHESYDDDAWTAELSVPRNMVEKLAAMCGDATFEHLGELRGDRPDEL
ncbi:MAG: GTPase HflX, partial [Myxococcota bacterium]